MCKTDYCAHQHDALMSKLRQLGQRLDGDHALHNDQTAWSEAIPFIMPSASSHKKGGLTTKRLAQVGTGLLTSTQRAVHLPAM